MAHPSLYKIEPIFKAISTTVLSASKMGRLLSTGYQLQISLFFLVCCFTCLNGASLTVEQRLQALEATNVEIKEILVAKNQRLEALETEVQQLKSIVIELQNEKNVIKNDVTTANNQATGKNSIFRTCRETHLADPSLPSGLQWIDPDGQGVGDDPIQVYCDMATGTTSVLHDSELPTDVGHCADPGCYSKSISYSATMRQMTTLAELSSECHQSIRYDCNFAPFEVNGVSYSWWNDRNEKSQYFWAGSNSSAHTCQCGIDNNCLESTMRCNCDSGVPIPEFDNGVITNKELLPVTRLNFGRTVLETSSGVYTLGRFECSGQVAVNGMASSCSDLWRIGHTLSGFYSVKGAKMIESFYCDFTKLPSDAGFEKRMGFLDVKSSPTFFYVQRSTPFSQKNVPIPFEVERVNIGGAMNLTSGIFTAPRTGLYFFTFSGLFESTTAGHCALIIHLVWNGNAIGASHFDSFDGRTSDNAMISLQSTLELKAGDTVWLRISTILNAMLYDQDSYYYTHFTGQLLQEDISQSFL